MHYHYATPAANNALILAGTAPKSSQSSPSPPGFAMLRAMPQPGTIETTDTRTDPTLDTPWHVVVHNDPINLMSYVTLVFMRVFGYPRQRAERHMLEVHHHGRSILWTGNREQAEHYVHQLHSYQLLAQLQKAA